MKLYYLILILFILAVLKGIYNGIHAVILRASFYVKLGKIGRKKGCDIEKPRCMPASFFGYSRRPDIIVRTADTEYLVRIITCRARKRIYHFVDHEWFVRAFRLYLLMPFLSGESYTILKRCKHLPPLDGSYINAGERRQQVVLLFNPSPLDITYTTRSNRREIGSNGADFDGWLIYNSKGFLKLLEDIENTSN